MDMATARNAGTRVCLARYGFGFRFSPADFRGDELFVDSPAGLVESAAPRAREITEETEIAKLDIHHRVAENGEKQRNTNIVLLRFLRYLCGENISPISLLPQVPLSLFLRELLDRVAQHRSRHPR